MTPVTIVRTKPNEHEPDTYFTEAQIDRLGELMVRSKSEPALTPEEEAERDALIEAEFLASAQRTEVLADAGEERQRKETGIRSVNQDGREAPREGTWT
jgi:hypothetical protein